MATVVVAGATGFIGTRLCAVLRARGWRVRTLARRPDEGDLVWDGASSGEWETALDGTDAVINLAGAPIAMPWTEGNRKLIRDSRTQSAEAIGRAIVRASDPPSVWINSSAVGFYGDRGDEELTESSGPGKGFLSEISVAWEEAAERWELPDTRLVVVRTGIVLGKGGGALKPLEKVARSFLGGAAGDGSQWMPWISLEDLCRLYLFALTEPVEGPLNGCAPEPVRNRDFMSKLRRAVRRPWAPPVPALALSAAAKFGGPDPSMLLGSTRAVPRGALEAGFRFEDAELDALLCRLVA